MIAEFLLVLLVPLSLIAFALVLKLVEACLLGADDDVPAYHSVDGVDGMRGGRM
jgi:hypothetical protein